MPRPASRATLRAVAAALRASGSVFAEEEAEVLASTAGSRAELAERVRRRAAGSPLEQLVGWAVFDGRRVAIAPGVFVPRRRTELLAHEAIARARAAPGNPEGRPLVVELCCGAGAVGAAVLAALPRAALVAADVDPAAVAVARRNLAGTSAVVRQGDLFAALPGALQGRVDVLVANPPYVPTGEIRLLPAEARLHEPRAALDGGTDGLDIARRIAADAPGWLAAAGALLIETGEHQAPALAAAFARHGLEPAVISDDDRGATVVVGTARPGG
jgi:release factor glutamine methyltransferase